VAIEFPSTKSTKDSIRAAIGQTVSFYLEGSYTECSLCSGANLLDGINKTSLNSLCSECSGAYYLFTDDVVTTTAHVRWNSQDISDKDTAGESFVGDCSITIDIDVLTSDQISSIKYIIADSRKLNPTQKIYRGVPTRDRIRFLCTEFEKS